MARRRNPSKGLIVLPIRKATYHGKRGYGVEAYKNGRQYAAIFTTSLDNAIMVRDLLESGHKYYPMLLRGVIFGKEVSS